MRCLFPSRCLHFYIPIRPLWGAMMSVHTLASEAPVLVLADLHRDDYLRLGLDVFMSNGLGSLIGPRYAAVVIAGDLINDPQRQLAPALRWLIDLFAPAPVFFLVGNHDFYRHGIDQQDQLRGITEAAGAIYAQKLEVVQNDTRFLIATLWTDYSLGGDPVAAMRMAASVMNDHRLISMPSARAAQAKPEERDALPRVAVSPTVLREIHRDHRAWLYNRLAEPFSGRTAVITHHSPHPSVHGKLDGLSPAFCSDLSDLILRHGPDLWLFGHTHRRLTAQVGRTTIRNVSIGYAGEHLGAATPEFLAGCVISEGSWG